MYNTCVIIQHVKPICLIGLQLTSNVKRCCEFVVGPIRICARIISNVGELEMADMQVPVFSICMQLAVLALLLYHSAIVADGVIRLYYKNATHQLTNVTETHEKSLRKRIE